MQTKLVKILFQVLAAALILSGCSEDKSSTPQNPPTPAPEVRTIQDAHVDWVLKFVNARFMGGTINQVPRHLKIALAGAFAQEALVHEEFTETDIIHPMNQIHLQRIFNKIQERHL